MINRVPIKVPAKAMPKKDLEHPCPCQDKPIKLQYKTGTILWYKKKGDNVEKDELICEGEVEKKTIEFFAPCSGILSEVCINDDEEFEYDEILGYIETKEGTIYEL